MDFGCRSKKNEGRSYVACEIGVHEMKPEIYENTEEGIKVVYTNDEWSVSIKNWKPDNDILDVGKMEVHHTTDE